MSKIESMTINKIKINTSVVDSFDLQKKLSLAISGTFLVLLSLYALFSTRMVFNIIERKNAENEMQILSSNISNLGVEYMSLAKDIHLDLAKSLGFNQPKSIYFASRRSAVGSLIKKADEL